MQIRAYTTENLYALHFFILNSPPPQPLLCLGLSLHATHPLTCMLSAALPADVAKIWG